MKLPKKCVLDIKIFMLLLTVLFFFLPVNGLHSSEKNLKLSEKYISEMRSGLNKVALKIRKATEKTNIALLNCLKRKEKKMKNYMDSSLRNQENLRSAWKVNDSKESQRFLKLIGLAHKKYKEVEASIKECYRKEVLEDGTRVKVIKPEGALEDDLLNTLFPEDSEESVEGMPAVAPASPYR